MPSNPLEGVPMQEMINEANAFFDEECFRRHEMGAEKYGPVRYLEPDNDLFKMLMEEFVDAANYARYLYVRLSIMHQLFNGRQVLANTPLGPKGIINPYAKDVE